MNEIHENQGRGHRRRHHEGRGSDRGEGRGFRSGPGPEGVGPSGDNQPGEGSIGFGPGRGHRKDRGFRSGPGPVGFGPRGDEDSGEGFGPGRHRGGHGFGPGPMGFGPRGDEEFGEGFGPGRRGLGRRGPGRGRGPGRRMRGDVRTAVLLLLADEPMHGYQLMQTIAERTDGLWSPSPGAIYPTINQLEDEGLVTVVAEGGRKLVTLTETGTQHVAENRETWPNPFPSQDADAVNLRDSLGQVAEATRQVGRSGTDAQRTAAAKVLATARRELYLLLADDGTDDDAETNSTE